VARSGRERVRGQAVYVQDTRPLENRLLFWEWMLTAYCMLTVIVALSRSGTGVWPVSLVGLCSIGLLTLWSFRDRHMGRDSFHAQASGMTLTDTKHVQP